MRLLVIEDETKLAQLLANAFGRAGFSVTTVGSTREGLAAVEQAQFDAAILDLGLPDDDGLVFLQYLRSNRNTLPVLILSARHGVPDKVVGLDTGADDYVGKPFEMSELLARVRALLRRPGGALGMNLEAGNVRFDTVTREVTVEGNIVNLTPRERVVLELLLRRVGRMVPKFEFDQLQLESGEDIRPNVLDIVMYRLRRRLRDYGADVAIHTFRGAGYVLTEEENVSG